MKATLIFSIFAVSLLSANAQVVNGKLFPSVDVKLSPRGADIIPALGNRLPEIAAWYGRTEAELKETLMQNSSIHANSKGVLYYVCAAPPVNASGIKPRAISPQPAAAALDPFKLHSKLGATRVIYLDFDGHVTTDTIWNTDSTGGAPIVTPPYSVDGVAAFSTVELLNIVNIWKSVSEDYAPFNVDVTTEDPGVASLIKTNAADVAYGVRVCIGGSNADWFNEPAGGVAYLNSFNWNSDTPAMVFPANLRNGDPKFVAEACSHEVGHTFNLNHDGQTAAPGSAAVEYYQGHANWAPIMGVGYYSEVVQFSKGEYTRASNKEDDLAIIKLSAPAFADEATNSDATAADISNAGLLYNVTATGIIGTSADVDRYKFVTRAGTISFKATAAEGSPNLDILVSLYNSLGALVTSGNSTTSLSATLSATVDAGTYYVTVEGVGTGTPVVAYNDYDSLGKYTLTGKIIGTGNQPPVAIVSTSYGLTGYAPLTSSFSGKGSKDPDGTIASYQWDFGDGSATSSLVSPKHTYTVSGIYTATLTVTDNLGATGSDVLTVVAKSPIPIYVDSISVSIPTTLNGFFGKADVRIVDANGAVRRYVTVTGEWSGATTGTSTGITDSLGRVFLTSPKVSPGGTYTLTVTNATAIGYLYDPFANVETADSATRAIVP